MGDDKKLMSTLKYDPVFDVVVIGGGPAGAATAAYLAKAGIKVAVLEREKFPRAHVGESLVPSSTRIFQDLGFLEQMENAGFPHKYGAAWTVESNPNFASHSWDGLHADTDIRFAERAQKGVHQEYTYHVDRAKFDALLLAHAQTLGATVRQEATVQQVDFIEGSMVSIRYQDRAGGGTLFAYMVVDASGRHTFLGNKFDLRVKDKHFDQYALHTWFDDYNRGDDDKRDYLFVHFLPISDSWVWQIPITETITSIGVVTQKENFKKSNGSLNEFFWSCIDQRPGLSARLRAARQIRPLKAEADYSYAMKRLCGDRWLLVGDAARFVDPIFSSGVSVALQSAKFASEIILHAIAENDFSRSVLLPYEETLRRGCNNWYDFISLYYRLNIAFTYFVNHKDYRIDILRLLQGDVYDDDKPAVLQKMRNLIATVEKNPNHLWHPLLGKLRSDL